MGGEGGHLALKGLLLGLPFQEGMSPFLPPPLPAVVFTPTPYRFPELETTASV